MGTKVGMSVINFDSLVNEGKNSEKTHRHSELLPNTIRAIICGPSNCGKTNAMHTLITHPNGLKFENIYVYSKSLQQPKYQFLENFINSINGIIYFPFSDNEQVISPQDANSNVLMIFDDVACEKQDNIRAYFSMGRHAAVDSFYITQSYARIPKHLIRENDNILILFQQDEKNLRHVYEDRVNTDMTFREFKDLSLKCWNKDKYNFIMINKDCKFQNRRYRCGFDKWL